MSLRFHGIFQRFWYHKYELLSIFSKKNATSEMISTNYAAVGSRLQKN